MSALVGASFSCLALRSSSTLTARALSGLIGSGLLTRAATGRCAVKAALLGEGVRLETIAEPPESPHDSVQSARVDEGLEGSFPASDPPASRLPDAPPRNAEDKWKAAKSAENGPQNADRKIDKDH
jgi:hypothetical protein